MNSEIQKSEAVALSHCFIAARFLLDWAMAGFSACSLIERAIARKPTALHK
jgi:hypothetical protein